MSPPSYQHGSDLVEGRDFITPNETSEGNITEEIRVEGEEATAQEQVGLGAIPHQEFNQGVQRVVNLSSRVLSEAELSVLSKGLKFCPTPEEIDVYQLRKDITEYVRRIRLREFFYSDEEVAGNFSDVPAFKKKSTWCPDKNREMVLEAYVLELEKQILSSALNKRVNRNLTREEQQALTNLRRYNDIIIKEADKGSGVVVMDRDKYILEGMRQLNDRTVYVRLPEDPTMEMRELINSKVQQLHADGFIDEDTLNYLWIDGDTKAGRFYLLPKLHKKGCPGRPVISGSGTPTEKISEFVDSHLKPLVPLVNSYIKDTNDFLRKVINMGKLPEGSILVTIDVVGLYPHIPHEEGLQAIREALDGRLDVTIPTERIVELAALVLSNNNFEFNGENYLQKLGTAIGTRMAPSYANLFMDRLERSLLDGYHTKPYTWFRFIDDIFMVWTAGEEELKNFLEYLNSAHDTIKFTWEWSMDRVNFLDVKVINSNGILTTDLYVKPTDKHQYLDFRSCHPRGCKEGIPYAQALRLRRICSSDKIFDNRAAELIGYLVARGYDERFVRRQIRRAKRINRNEALTPAQERKKNNRTPFVVTYHPGLPNIGGILRDLHPLLHMSDRCKKAIKECPMVAFRRPKSLKDYLVNARIRPDNNNSVPGNYRCSSTRCEICRNKNYLNIGNTFVSNTTGKSYNINYNLDCNSSSVIYLLSCKICGKQYVGSTVTKFRLRFNNHRSRLRGHSRLEPGDRASDDLIYKHFFTEGHNGLDDVSVQIIDKVYGSVDNLLEKEGQWAYRLRTIAPEGLNESDFFYCQNRRSRARN